MSDPTRVILQHVKIHHDSPAISYSFMLDGEQRIISYAIDDDRLTIVVRETPRGKPFVQLRATRAAMHVRTPEGEFRLQRDKRVLPVSTDARSMWLLRQNPITNTTTAPNVLIDRATQELDPGTTTSGIKVDVHFPGLDDLWDWLTDDECLTPDQSTQCTSTDANNESTTITFTCDCGIPICTNQTVTIEVPVIVTDADGTHTETESVSYTICVCWCMETAM